MKISGKILRFFVVVLISAFLSFIDAYALEDKAHQGIEENNEKIVLILQKGISLIKYEIQRDKAIISGKILIPKFRKLRKTLKNDIGPKKQLINDLQSLLPKELTGEIGLLRRTLEAENKIIPGKKTSKRVRRVTRNSIKGLIPIKEQILASFEKFLSEIIIEQDNEKTSK